MLTRNGFLALMNSSSKSYKNVEGATQSASGSNVIGNSRVSIGTGTDAVTIDDYTLTEITTLAASNINIAKNAAYEDAFMAIITTTYTNSTGADVVVNEIGWEYVASGVVSILLARELIEPVTIAAGQSKTFTLKVG